jgi:methanogenic corrinoid protein MtbC1
VNDVPSFLAGAIPAEMVETFTHLIFSPDASDSAQLIEQLLEDGVSPEAIMLELLAPAAKHLGHMWCEDEVNFLEVTLGLSRIQHVLRHFRFPAMGALNERGSALLVTTPGEQHILGLRVVEEFLLRDGWRVRCTPVPDLEQLRQLVSGEHYDFVGFSISGERFLPALRSAIRETRAVSRNRQVRILVGGVLFAGQDRGGHSIDADATVRDAHEAVAQAKHWYALAGAT